MHDNPRPTEEEQEQAPERLEDEDEMRGPMPAGSEGPPAPTDDDE